MPDFTPLSITSEPSDDVWRVVAEGELDVDGAAALEAAVVAGLDATVAEVVLDLSGISFIDSSGLRVLVDAAAAAAREDTHARLRIISSPSVDRVVDLSGLRDHLPLG